MICNIPCFIHFLQVLSSSVANAFELSERLEPTTRSTRLFIRHIDQFFDCLNVRRRGQDRGGKPALAEYTSPDDWRFKVNKTIS